MSSSKYILAPAVALALAIGISGRAGLEKAQPAEQPLVCPPAITVAVAAEHVEGWSAQPEKAQHPFERISVFNRDRAHDYDLAPDSEQRNGSKVSQSWNLKDYRSLPIFLSCRYHDTPVTLSKELPASLSTCSLTFQLDRNGKITGESYMACR